MRIAMIGTGYVGLVSGACFSEFGLDVVCVDKDPSKIEGLRAGKIPIFEPGLDKLVAHNVAAGRLSFTLDLQDAVRDADAVFIAVGTPLGHKDGQADLTHLYAAVRDVARFAGDKCRTVVIKSTVPVGTGREVARLLSAARPDIDFDVVSNPEFLREGAAINDFMRPDRVIIGAETTCARILMRELYRPLYLIETPIVFTTLETSELTKYAGNAFLATKISFINQMADLCEAVGADVQDVAKGIGLDGRIGRKFLHAGPGYGGSCFPKDTQALASTARQFGCPVSLVEEVIHYNAQRKKRMVDRVITALEGTAQGKTVAVLGLTFKPNTDDMRDAPAIDLVSALVSAGAVVRAYDPEGMDEARKVLPPVTYCSSPYEAMQGADVAVIVTEWNEFRGLDMSRLRTLLSAPRLVDLRNIYEPDDMRQQGISYHSIGRCAPNIADSAGGGKPLKEKDFFEMSERLHPDIVREYDLRGIVGETLFPEDAVAIGVAYGTCVRRAGGSAVAVGYDGRLSSPTLADALSQGILSTGVDVVLVGCGPTPLLYFAAFTCDVFGGIMVTGSHNPPTHNGFKIVFQKKPFFGESLRALAALVADGDFEHGQGKKTSLNLGDAYLNRLLSDLRFCDSDLQPDFKVIWDAGNGATGDLLTRLIPRIPGQHEALFTEVDGTFPNHHPDPAVADNLADLRARVLETEAQLGIAFDGDGDRIGLVDEEGEILWGDQIMLFLALDLLKTRPGATFIADVKASQVLFDEITRAGGQAIMWKTGHSHIKNKMAETGAAFAGEMSAHLFFADRYYGYDDALYAAIRILNALVASGRSLAQFRKSLPPVVNTPEIRIDLSEDRKFRVVEEVAARLDAEGEQVCQVDGVRVLTEDGWWLLRASNTQAALVARCEARDHHGLTRLQAALSIQLEKSGVVIEF